MDSSSHDYDETDFVGKLLKHNLSGLGFFGGSAWRYPEEEIEFFHVGEEEDENPAQQNDANESCSGEIRNCFRIAMIENVIHAHDIHDDDHDLSSVINCINHSLSMPSSPIVTVKRHTQYIKDENHRDGDARLSTCVQHRNNNTGLPETSQIFPNRNKCSLMSKIPRKRCLRAKDTTHIESVTSNEKDLHHFQEAAMCIPFEYTTKNAAFYIRRPYGLITAPEIFRAVNTHITDEEYKKQSRVSSSHTIEVAIAISADNSSMLLYGSAGARFYKTDPSVDQSGYWVDIPDVDTFGIPLGYVNKGSYGAGNVGVEYSLDEILEEAMFVREQYCNSMLSTVSEAVKRQLFTTAKYLSPPSLAKSIVSTPPRSSYYYDGSSSFTKAEVEKIKGRKLDFIKCISPSLMARHGNEMTVKLSRSWRKVKRRQLYQLLQRIFFVVAFYICGTFLVSNISAVDYHRTSHVVSELPSYKACFSHNLISSIFITKKNDGIEQQTRGNNPSQLFQIFEMSAKERTESDALIKTITEERNYHRTKFETSNKVVQRQQELNNVLSLNYSFERTKTEELQKRVMDAGALIKYYRDQKETLAVELKIEQDQQQVLKETIRKLEIQIMVMAEGKRPSKQATGNGCLETPSVETNSQAGTPMVEELINLREYEMHRYQKSWKESSETTALNFMDMKDLPGENRSLDKSVNLVQEKEQLCAVDDYVSTSPKNEMLSIENVILRSARAKKGPIFPKLYRKMRRRFSSNDEIEEEYRKKIKGFASSVKYAIVHSARKLAGEK